MAARLFDLETLGLRYFRRRSALLTLPEPTDPVHILNADERAALRRIERAAIARAAVAGALSALFSASAEILAERAGLGGTTAGTAVVLGATIVATGAEIAFLFWDGLRSVHELARAAGVRLFAGNEGESVAQALARAALELPNRPDPQLGVDPHRETSRVMLVVAAVLYKAKIGLTNFLVRALLRRLGGRTAMRSWLPLAAVPITAAWNAWVAWTVLREARIRAMGPSAVAERLDVILGEARLSDEGRLAAMRAVGCAVVRKRNLHPNLAAVLLALRARVGDVGAPLDDREAFLAQLPALRADERRIVMDILALALVIDGRLTRRERHLLHEAQAAVGTEADDADVRRLRRAFLRGEPLGLVQGEPAGGQTRP